MASAVKRWGLQPRLPTRSFTWQSLAPSSKRVIPSLYAVRKLTGGLARAPRST